MSRQARLMISTLPRTAAFLARHQNVCWDARRGKSLQTHERRFEAAEHGAGAWRFHSFSQRSVTMVSNPKQLWLKVARLLGKDCPRLYNSATSFQSLCYLEASFQLFLLFTHNNNILYVISLSVCCNYLFIFFTVFLYWFGSFLGTEMTLKNNTNKHPTPTGTCSQQKRISHSFHNIANVFAHLRKWLCTGSLQIAQFSSEWILLIKTDWFSI